MGEDLTIKKVINCLKLSNYEYTKGIFINYNTEY